MKITCSLHSAGETFLKSTGGESYSTEYDPGGRVTRITYPGNFGEAALEVLYTYYDDNQVKEIIARDLTGSTPVEIYVIEYMYDAKGRRTRQTVWNDRTNDDWPQYDAFYKYDHRDRLVSERYMRMNETTERMAEYRKREYTYDNAINLTVKKTWEEDAWIQYALTYSKGSHITGWTNTVSSGSVDNPIAPTYDSNGNLTRLYDFSVSGGGPSQFDFTGATFTYDRKNRLKTYVFSGGDTRTLYWDALGRIREKTWTIDATDYHQAFYHDGRTLLQIWDEAVDDTNVTRTIAYDLYKGKTGYLKDIDFNSNPDYEGFLIKDAQGTIRAIVKVAYASGTYTVTTERYNLDGYGDWLDFDAAHSNGSHYMRYVSCRVEDYGNPGSSEDNLAIVHTDHRHYLPFLGIFLQREPLMVWPSSRSLGLSENLANLNPYRYSQNQPTISSDSSGLQSVGACNRIRNACNRNCLGRDDEVECAERCEEAHQTCLNNLNAQTQIWHADYLNEAIGLGMQNPLTSGTSGLMIKHWSINYTECSNHQNSSNGASILGRKHMLHVIDGIHYIMCLIRAQTAFKHCMRNIGNYNACADLALKVFKDCFGLPLSGWPETPVPGCPWLPISPDPANPYRPFIPVNPYSPYAMPIPKTTLTSQHIKYNYSDLA